VIASETGKWCTVVKFASLHARVIGLAI